MSDPSLGALEIELVVESGVQPGVEAGHLTGAAEAALGRLGVDSAHLAIEIVGEARIQELNREHRGRDRPTDVLSFPVDGEGLAAGEPLPQGAEVELGDVVICPPHAEDMAEAVVHGVLHLCGFDHEADDGQMLELQDSIMAGLARPEIAK